MCKKSWRSLALRGRNRVFNLKNFLFVFVIFCSNLFYTGIVFASVVISEGEALIENNDKSSAKAVALLRAKWAAIESVSPANNKVDTIINNSKILDEAIKTELTATISSFSVVEEKVENNKYYIKIKANVVDNAASKMVARVSKDNSLCVLIGGIMPNGRVEFNNNFTLKSISLLNDNGFDVAEINYNTVNHKDFTNAVNVSNYKNIINITNSYGCKNIFLGSLSIIDKGNNTGYGTFNISIAGGNLTWKLINNDNKLLKTGFFSDRGQGATFSDAAISIYNNMAKTTAVKLVSQVSEEILGAEKKSIRVVLTGSNTNLDDFNELRNDLKQIPFVLEISELNTTSLVVNYPDTALYLGIFLERGGKYKVVDLSDNELIIRK